MTSVSDLPEVSAGVLIERYEALFLDAYGVLVHQNGPLPLARAFIEHLNTTGKPYWLLSNDASRLTTTTAERYRSFGLAIGAERILNSGSLLADHFRAATLHDVGHTVAENPMHAYEGFIARLEEIHEACFHPRASRGRYGERQFVIRLKHGLDHGLCFIHDF